MVFYEIKNKHDYISKAYDSSKIEELQSILKMLKAQKQMIIELVQQKLA